MADLIQDNSLEGMKAHFLGPKRSPLEEAATTEGVPAATQAAAAPDDPLEGMKAHFMGQKPEAPSAPSLSTAAAVSTAAATPPMDPLEGMKAHFMGQKPPVQVEPTAKGVTPDALTMSFDPTSRYADAWTTPGEGVVGHAWGVANTPFVAETDLERWLDPFIGKPEDHGAIFGGIQKGVYDLVSGLTTPLSFAFVIGTMGAGALAKSGGEALLRTAGKMSAADIAEVVKGSQFIMKAEKLGQTSDQALIAMEQSGINSKVVLDGLDTLKKGGMTTHDLIRGGLVHTAGAAALRKVGLSAKQAELVPKLAQELIDGGFVAANVYGAITAFPSALDALKEGNVGLAAELITTSAGMAGFGLMGTHALLKEAGGSMDPLLAKLGLHAKPGDTNVRLGRAWGVFDEEVLRTAHGHKLDVDALRKDPEFADIAKKPEELHRVFNYVQAGGDDELMKERGDRVRDSAGRELGVALRGELPEAPKIRQDQPTVNAAAPDAAVLREPEEYLGGRISAPVEGSTEAGLTETLRGPAKRIEEAQRRLKGFTGHSKYQPGTEFDFSRELGVVGRPPGGVYPNVPGFKFNVGFEEKLGREIGNIKNDQGTDTEASLSLNQRGEYTLALSGNQLKAFNEATLAPGWGGALEIARGASANPSQTNGMIDRLLYNADPAKIKLGEMLQAAKDKPLAIIRLTGEQPFVTMLHEHVHGILSDEQVAAVMSRVQTMPGYDRLAKRVRGISAAGMSYPESEIPGELLSRLVAGQMYGRDVPRAEINAILWEAINNLPSQAAYEKIVGNLEPGVRDQIYGHIQEELTAGKGREVSPGVAAAPAGRGAARPGIDTLPPERGPRGIPEANGPALPREAGVRKDITPPTSNRQMIDLKTGEVHPVSGTHNEWATEKGFKGAYDAMDKGFARVLYSPHETYIHLSDKVNLQTAMRRLADIVRPREKPITVDVGDHTKGYRYYNFANLDEMKEASPADLKGLRKDLEPDEKFVPREPPKDPWDEPGIVDWDSPKIYAGVPGTFQASSESNYWVSPKGKVIMVSDHAPAARTMGSSYGGLFDAGYSRVVSTGDGELNIELDRNTPRRTIDNVLKKLDYRPRIIYVDESGAIGMSSSRTFGNVRELHQWMSGPRIIPADIEKALKDQNISAGFTVNPHTGKTPQVGYSVEVVPEWRRTLNHNTTPADVADFAKSNQTLLEENPHLFIGGDGRELNISAVFDSLDEATEVAKKLDQKAIWDVANSRAIDTGGQGKQTSFPDYGIPQRMAVSKFGSIPTDVQGALNLRRDLGPERGVTDEDRLKELASRRLIKEKYTEKEIDALIDSYDPSKLTQAHRNLASKIAVHFRDTLERAQKAGVLEEGLEHYVTQLWQKEADNPAANRLRADARLGRFAVNTSMARHRVFDHAIEGQLLGRKLAVTDPIALAAHNGATFDRVIAARRLLEHLRETGTQAADGRPMVALSGTGSIVQGEEGENPAVLIHPDRMQSVRIADAQIDGLRATGDLDRLIAEKKIVKWGEVKPTEEGGKGVQHYAWATNDYKSMEHPAFQGWKVPSEDTSGNPIFMRADLKVHPDAYEYMQRQLETKSPLAQALKPAFVAGREAKGILLSFDVFHLVQEGLRAVMTGISPFGVERWDLRTNPMLGKLVEYQLTLVDYGPRNTFQEGQMVGHSHLLNKIPGIGPANAWFQDFLFKKYIPGLKARAAEHLYGRYEKLYPEYKDPSTAITLPDGRIVYPKLLEMAAKDTNMRFGGLNLRREGRAVATQDVFRLIALAPDWLESEIRAFSLALGGDGRVMRRDIAKLSVGLWLAARVLNKVNTGNAHYEAPFGVAYQDDEGREKIVSLRTLPTDILHAVTDPLKFMRYRASPLERTISTVYSGRDEMGRRLPARDLVWDVLGDAAVPLPLQNVVKKMSGFMPEQDWKDLSMRGFGGQVTTFKTEAQKKAATLAADRSESGPIDKDKLREHVARLQFEDQIRSGQSTHDDLVRAVEEGLIGPKDAKVITKNVQETRGMDPNLARLYTRAGRLPMSDFLDVWEVATVGEQKVLERMMQKKRAAYVHKVNTDMSAPQRKSDVTYQRIRRMFPAFAPF